MSRAALGPALAQAPDTRVESPGYALQLERVSKRYPNGILANAEVSLGIVAGEIHAIVGENGAGKSTALKLMYGLERPDSGSIVIDGTPAVLRSPRDAMRLGIGLVPQHLKLVQSFTVAENITLGNEPCHWGFIRSKADALESVEALCARYGLPVDASRVVGELAIGVQQRVEILKALRGKPRVLLLDEPTSLLSPQEAEALFESLEALASQGMAIVMVSHKVPEIRQVAKRFTVMRGGRVVAGGIPGDFSDEQLSELIVGQQLPRFDAARKKAERAPLLQVRNLSVRTGAAKPRLADVDLDIAAGEILGIAGVEGSGQSALFEVLCGLRAPTTGLAALDGKAISGAGVRHARESGVAYVPEDRMRVGFAPGLSLAENLFSGDYFKRPQSRRGVIDPQAMALRARRLIARFGIRPADENVSAGMLSGGNIQKAIVAREIDARPGLLLAAQPTRGVDIAAAQELHAAIVALRDSGAAILLSSTDLGELFTLADRIIVLFEGRIVAHFSAEGFSQLDIGLAMTGMAIDPRANGLLPALGANRALHGTRAP